MQRTTNPTHHPRPPRAFRATVNLVLLGAVIATSSALAQVQPGTGHEASAPGADRSAPPNTRTTQNESQGRADQPSPERVIVTGSFIPTAEGEGALPVAVFTQDDLRKQGANSAVEGLRRLPSFVGAATTENDANAGTGRAGINLRALGEQNVLVLLNGHRAAGSPLLGQGGFSDGNAIPFGAIDHIEVLKDGASAQYGSDAVAGVVNFIFKTQFEGAQVDFLFGNTTNNDQSTERASVITGFSTKDKRFNIVLNANYYHANEISSRDRFISSIANATRLGGSVTSAASSNFPGRIQLSAGAAPLVGAPGANLVLLAGQGSTVAPTSIADYRVYDPGNDAFNARLLTPSIPQQERFAYYGATDYQVIPKALDVYAFGLYSNNRQYNALAPSPFPIGGAGVLIDPAFNPGLAAQYVTETNLLRASPYNPVPTVINPATGAATGLSLARYRTFENGLRTSLFDTKYYYGAFGVKGEILRTFNYDVTLVHEEDKQVTTNGGDARRSVLLAETASGFFNPFLGEAAPRAGTLNGFSYDNVAALRAASYIGNSVTMNNLNLAEARLSNTFFPDAPQGGISVAIGAEYRRESYDTSPDPVILSGDTLGFGAAPGFHAVQDVRSVFGEMRFPIVIPTMKVPGIYNLAFTVAGRYQKFFLNGTDPTTNKGVTPTFETTNQKYAFEYQPIQDIKFRGSYSTAFRAPDLNSLFAPAVPGVDFPELRDPVFGTAVQPTLGDTTAGNPQLQPENTDTYSLGMVLSPRWVKGLNITVDYYQINQNNVIITAGGAAQFFVDQAFINPTGPFAGFVQRDPATGELLSVLEVPFNAAKRRVEGIDITAVYEFDTKERFNKDFGKLTLTLNYNHIFRFNAQVSPTSGTTDFTGLFSAAPLTPGSIPYNKGIAQVEYQKDIGPGALDFIATVNYIGDFLDDGSKAFGGQAPVVDPVTGLAQDPNNAVYPRNRKVREYTTLDLQLSYTFKAPEPLTSEPASKDYKGKAVANAPTRGPSLWQKILGGTTLTVGCNDVFDTPPPFAAGAFNDNYDTSLYSIRNRFVYGAISKKF